jgi:hypothetical protein
MAMVARLSSLMSSAAKAKDKFFPPIVTIDTARQSLRIRQYARYESFHVKARSPCSGSIPECHEIA